MQQKSSPEGTSGEDSEEKPRIYEPGGVWAGDSVVVAGDSVVVAGDSAVPLAAAGVVEAGVAAG